MNLRSLFVILVVFVECGLSWAQQTVDVVPSVSSRSELADITGRIEISLQDPSASDFSHFEYLKNENSDLKLRYTSKALWIRLQLRNPTVEPLERIIYFTSGLTGTVELYRPSSQDAVEKSGSSVPYEKRSLSARLPAFRIHLDPNETGTFYFKRVSHHNLSSKIFLANSDTFAKEEMDAKAGLFFYVGGILCLIVYNLFLGISARDPNYFFYSLFTTALASAALNTQGFFDTYIFSEFSASHYLMVFSATAVLTCLLFVYRFLNIPQFLPKAKLGFYLLGTLGFLLWVEGVFPIDDAQVFFGHLIDLLIVTVLVFLVTCGIFVFRRGYKLAQFFLLSWVSLIIGVLGWFGMTYGLFHHSAITSHALMFGNMGEMLILSLGLAYKINILDKEKRRALHQAQEKERYHRLVKILSHDVANSISIFSGFLRRLKRGLEGHSELPTVEKLQSAVDNMRGILDFVRDEEALKSFRISASLKPVDLREVVQEVAHFYEDLIAQKSLQLEIHIPENSRVMADKTALSNQVISNLLSNSIKFSHPNSRILISVENSKDFTILKMQDFGVGILPEDIQRVFFSNEVTSKPGTLKERGSGLGSSLVKDYLAIFNGRIEVSSVHQSISKNSGTLISLIFPRI